VFCRWHRRRKLFGTFLAFPNAVFKQMFRVPASRKLEYRGLHMTGSGLKRSENYCIEFKQRVSVVSPSVEPV
jgi:hypothetical protein